MNSDKIELVESFIMKVIFNCCTIKYIKSASKQKKLPDSFTTV